MQPTAEQFTERPGARSSADPQQAAQQRRHQQLETEHLSGPLGRAWPGHAAFSRSRGLDPSCGWPRRWRKRFISTAAQPGCGA